jgi:hypothetical protein
MLLVIGRESTLEIRLQ